MMTLLRRYLVLVALMFWQGGFTFYASVVVPVGQSVLGRPTQAEVTEKVTVYLNIAGLVSLLPLLWDNLVCASSSARIKLGRWLMWLGLAITLALLFWLHGQLVEMLTERSSSAGSFRTGYRWYLWVSTVQWLFGIGYGLLALLAWREEDRLAHHSPKISS